VVAVGLAVDDVDCPRQDDVEGRIALALLELDVTRRKRQGLGTLSQLLDLSHSEAREQRRIARIQEALSLVERVRSESGVSRLTPASRPGRLVSQVAR
jgi:hypothetical protein